MNILLANPNELYGSNTQRVFLLIRRYVLSYVHSNVIIFPPCMTIVVCFPSAYEL